MGDKFHRLLNVTIVYPDGVRSIWDFFCGKVRKVDVFIETLPIPEKFAKADLEDKKFQNEFMEWLNAMWVSKDKVIDSALSNK